MNNPVSRDSKRPHPNPMPVDTQARPGKILAQARQAKGFSEADVASKLRLSIANVQAIEQDQYEKIPPVFIRGYIKNYAHILGVDESELPPLPKIEQPTPSSAHTPPKRSSPAYEISSNHMAVQAVTWTIVLGLIALLWLWSRGQLVWENGTVVPEAVETTTPTANQPEISIKKNSQDTVNLSTDKGVIVTPAVTPKPQPNTESIASNQAPLANASAPKTNTVPIAPVANLTTNVTTSILPSMLPALQTVSTEVPTNQPVTNPQVVIEFTGKCTVNIRDSKQKFKLTGRMRKGDKRVLEGVPPYTMKFSNASAVSVTIDGKPFDLKQHSKRGVANFVLDPEHLN